MTPTEMVLAGSLGLSFLHQVVMPRLKERRKALQDEEKAKREAAKETSAVSEVSWQAMNQRLVDERDKSSLSLREQANSYRDDITNLRREHAAEIAEIERRNEIAKAAADAQLRACQDRITLLIRELYTLGRESRSDRQPRRRGDDNGGNDEDYERG